MASETSSHNQQLNSGVPSKQYLEDLLQETLSDSKYLQLIGVKVPAIRVRTAAQRLADAGSALPLRQLCGRLWETPGIAILAGDTGVGKSVLAVHIAHLITSDNADFLGFLCDGIHRLVYYDFELSDRQFLKRFAGFPFTDYFLTGDTNPTASEVEEFTFAHICSDLDRTGASIVVLDNITALALKTTADADVSIGIMRGLKRLQQERGVSSLIIAHTPKIPVGVPLTLNHLAGSKHLSNFADSVFFIGRSVQSSSTRYIKQVKNRTDEELQGVVVCELHNEDGYLNFKLVGNDDEVHHLAASTGGAVVNLKAPIASVLAALSTYLAQPKSASQLEQQLGTFFSTDVRTIRKRLKELIDTNSYTCNLNDTLCSVNKEQRGRETWYSLQPASVSS
jgi:KaiC/GvpD/RAD55 family RecA-like ATPase